MKADDINTLCKIINENYCFWFNDEIWCNIVKKIQNNCVSFYDIRKMIFKMNDPHLAISYANRDRFVFVNLVEKKETLYLDVCSACHPFYTGKQKNVDTGGRIDKFKQRFSGMSRSIKRD